MQNVVGMTVGSRQLGHDSVFSSVSSMWLSRFMFGWNSAVCKKITTILPAFEQNASEFYRPSPFIYRS